MGNDRSRIGDDARLENRQREHQLPGLVNAAMSRVDTDSRNDKTLEDEGVRAGTEQRRCRKLSPQEAVMPQLQAELS